MKKPTIKPVSATECTVSFSAPTKRFRLSPADSLVAAPSAPVWLIKGLLEMDTTALLFGDPAAGKSLFALDWATCIAVGLEWHGRATRQGLVIYIAGEGHRGIRRRLKALQESKDITLADAPLFVSNVGAELISPQSAAEVSDEIAAIAKEHGRPALIIIDTLHRNLGPGDESNSGDIAQFLVNVDTLIRSAYECTVLIVHHAGHGDKTRARGSSSLRAAVDAEFRVTAAPGNTTELSCTKMKDAEPIPPIMFAIKPVELPWLDDDDEPVISVVLEPTGAAPEPRTGKKLTAPQRIALKALNKAIEQHGTTPPKDVLNNSTLGFGVNVVHVDQWRDMAYAMGISDSGQDARRKAFSRARLDLITFKKVETWADYCWPARPAATAPDKAGQCP